jgi:hypothetical protein
MPANQSPEFQNALRNAIQRFKVAKAPLRERHNEEIDIIENIINDDHLTTRELRDRAWKACKEINLKVWNWIGGSLLVDYITEVLSDPQFNVEKIYETVINQKDEDIELQGQVINNLKQENDAFKKNPKWYADQLRAELKEKDNVLIEAVKQQKLTTEMLGECNKAIQSLGVKLEKRDKEYNDLWETHVKALQEKESLEKKQDKTSNSQTGKNSSKGFFK